MINLKYIIIIFTLFYIFKFFLKKKNKEHYSNQYYNKKCSDEYKPNKQERKDCYAKVFEKSSDIFKTCVDTNINENINEEDANDYCRKWIGLVNTECTLEDCLENTYKKMEDWKKFTDIKEQHEKKMELFNDIFKYKSQISNDYYKDFNLKLNELEILIQNYNNKKQIFDSKYSGNAKIQSLIVDLLNNQEISNNNSIELSNAFEDFPFEQADKIMDMYKKLDLIILLIKSNIKIEENLYDQRKNDENHIFYQKSKKILKKLFYNHITEYDKEQLVKISKNNDFYLAKLDPSTIPQESRIIQNPEVTSSAEIDNNQIQQNNEDVSQNENIGKNIDYKYSKAVQNFINEVELKCNFTDKKLVDVAASYKYYKNDSIIMNYVNDIFAKNNNMNNKNELYKCVSENIKKLVQKLEDTNDTIFKSLVNKDVFINDLIICRVSPDNANSLSNILIKDPNIDYSLYENKITIDNLTIDFNSNYKKCITDSILNYTNFIRDTRARNL